MRGYFSRCKAEDAGGLTPGKDDNAAARKIDRKHEFIFKLVDYTVDLGEIFSAVINPVSTSKGFRNQCSESLSGGIDIIGP